MTDEEKQAIKYFYNLRSTIDESYMLFDEEINVKCGNETIKQISVLLNLIENQQAEIEVYKDIKELAGTEIKEILNWKCENKKLKSEIENLQKALATYTAHTVCSDIKQSYKHKEDLEMLYKGCQIELEEKDKIIDRMAKELTEERLSKFDWCSLLKGKGCRDEDICLECIKEYFKKKVEDK